MDALAWSGWHTYIVVALGITWVLDGLEVTLAGAVGNALTNHATLGLTNGQVGFSGTAYLAGAVIGALGFGYATDRFGRRKLFFVTLILYVAATAASAFSWSADQLLRLPRADRGRHRRGVRGHQLGRGRADSGPRAGARGPADQLHILGRGGHGERRPTIVLLNPAHFAVGNTGWRYAYGIGACPGHRADPVPAERRAGEPAVAA